LTSFYVLSYYRRADLSQLKEEFENDDEFLKDYIVRGQGQKGGPAAPGQQAQPA